MNIFYILGLMILSVSSISTVSANDEVDKSDDSDIEEYVEEEEIDIVSLINDNILNLSEIYYEETGNEWNIDSVEETIEIYDINDDLTAYLFVFNEGYLTASLHAELLDMSEAGASPLIDDEKQTYFLGGAYFYKEDGNYYSNSISEVNNLNELSGSINPFSSEIYIANENMNNYIVERTYTIDLKNKNGKYNAKYKVITGNQEDTTDCGAQAGLNYLYTLDFTNNTSFTKSKNWNIEINIMRREMNWETGGYYIGPFKFDGILPGDFAYGIHTYLNRKYFMFDIGNNYGLRVGVYASLNLNKTAHYALYVGEAKVKKWWIFYTYYDIISSWNINFNTDSAGNITTRNDEFGSNYYFVNHAYHVFYYTLI